MNRIKLSDVQISKYYDRFMDMCRPFWRADYQDKTIITLCRTKAECLREVQEWLDKQNKE